MAEFLSFWPLAAVAGTVVALVVWALFTRTLPVRVVLLSVAAAITARYAFLAYKIRTHRKHRRHVGAAHD